MRHSGTMKSAEAEVTRIVVFEQQGSAAAKIRGITDYGRQIKISAVYSIDRELPAFVDDPAAYIPNDFDADLVLNFLKHPDLSTYLTEVCQQRRLPVIASGRRIKGAIAPFT